MKTFFKTSLFIFLVFLTVYVSTISSEPETEKDGNKNIHKFESTQSIMDTTIKEVMERAKSDLQLFLKQIPPGSENLYGFDDRSQFSIAEIGMPYELYTIYPSKLENPEKNTINNLESLNEWLAPVKINNKCIIFLTVIKTLYGYETVNLGWSGLAKELEQYKNIINYAEKRIILRQYQLKSDFLIITDDSNSIASAGIYPLKSAKLSFGEKTFQKNSYKLSELFEIIRNKYLLK